MEFRGNDPIYMQVAERICDEILTGVYGEQERIPSVREYGAIVEVNPNTIVRTYDQLQQSGIIYNKRGLGYFVAEGARQKILEDKRSHFISEVVPDFFRRLDYLGISIEEVAEMYSAR